MMEDIKQLKMEGNLCKISSTLQGPLLVIFLAVFSITLLLLYWGISIIFPDNELYPYIMCACYLIISLCFFRFVIARPIVFDIQNRIIIFPPWTKIAMDDFIGFYDSYAELFKPKPLWLSRRRSFALFMVFNGQEKEKKYILRTYNLLSRNSLAQMYSLRKEVDDFLHSIGVKNTGKQKF